MISVPSQKLGSDSPINPPMRAAAHSCVIGVFEGGFDIGNKGIQFCLRVVCRIQIVNLYVY